jgi:hypothetical protein
VKTNGGGVLTADDVKFDAMEEHRRLHGADGIALIGPGFDGRVTKWAKERKVALLTAGELAEVVARHLHAPLYPHELSRLLSCDGAESLAQRWAALERRQRVIAHLLDVMWKCGNDPVDVEYTRGILGVREIWREGKTMLETPLDDGEIRDALAFLTSPFVAAVSGVDNGYVVATPPRAAAARLRALAMMIDAVTPPEAENPSRSWQSADTELPATRPRPADVRAWAKARGRGISDRGRVSQRIVQEYLHSQQDR